MCKKLGVFSCVYIQDCVIISDSHTTDIMSECRTSLSWKSSLAHLADLFRNQKLLFSAGEKRHWILSFLGKIHIAAKVISLSLFNLKQTPMT